MRNRVSTSWVAPAKEDCQYKENCSTLEEYAKTGAFKQSNVAWIFKEGEHVLNGTTNVHNATLIVARKVSQQILTTAPFSVKGTKCACSSLLHHATSRSVTYALSIKTRLT